MATPAVGPAYGQQANTPLVDEIPPDSLAALISAAEQGDARAQFNLGLMYTTEEGVPEDYVLAYAWMNLAGAQGDDRAQEAKDRLSRRMTGEQVARSSRVERRALAASVAAPARRVAAGLVVTHRVSVALKASVPQ